MAEKHYHNFKQRKRIIVEAAIRLGRVKGVAGTSIRDICREAEISVGTFYHYFDSKDALMREAFLHFDMTIADETYNKYDALDPVEAVRRVLLDQTAYSANVGVSLLREYYRVQLQPMEAEAVSQTRQYYSAVERYVTLAQQRRSITDDREVGEIAEYLVRCVRGCLVDWCLREGRYDVVERVRTELDYYLMPFVTGN